MVTNLKPGDVVRLNSGGEPMTVFEINGENITVTWFTKAGEHKIYVWPASNLVKVAANDPPFALTRR